MEIAKIDFGHGVKANNKYYLLTKGVFRIIMFIIN